MVAVGSTTIMAANFKSVVADKLASVIPDPTVLAGLMHQIFLKAGMVPPPCSRRGLRQRRQHRAR